MDQSNYIVNDERSKLLEDEEKLREELHLYWDYDSEEEEAEEAGEQLLIDLENDASDRTLTARSVSSSYASQSYSNTADDDESKPVFGLPPHVNYAEGESCPQKTLLLNKALQEQLIRYIENIEEALERNKEKLEQLDADTSDTSKTAAKGTSFSTFRAPYFRDLVSYPPANEDVIEKKQNMGYDTALIEALRDTRPLFRKTSVLRKAVIENCRELLLKPLMLRMEATITKRDSCTSKLEDIRREMAIEKSNENSMSESGEVTLKMLKKIHAKIRQLEESAQEKEKELKECQEEIIRLEQDMKERQNISEDEVLLNVDSEKIDWMKISKQNFGADTTWINCQKAWDHQLSSKVNRLPWKRDEEARLKKLVAKSKGGDWDKIASDLGTDRTPFQCFNHYQSNLNPQLKSRPWTEEEDAKLLTVCNHVKDVLGFFSWRQAASLMDSRSPKECSYRYIKIDPKQNHGRWTQEEDGKLLAGLEVFGPSWSRIAKFIGTRNMLQCRDRYINCLAPNINFSNFTYDEDAKLLRLHKEHGSAWCKMAPHFQGRTDSMLLSRYRTLQKWKSQTQWFDNLSTQAKMLLLGKSLSVAERKQQELKAKEYLSMQLGVSSEDYKRQEQDRRNRVDPEFIPPRPPFQLNCFNASRCTKPKGLAHWAKKITFHRMLTENLYKLLAKDNQKNGKMTPETTQKLMQLAVNETVEENKQDIYPSNVVLSKRVETALNKAFLKDKHFNVQELLSSAYFKEDLEKKRVQVQTAAVENEIKSIIFVNDKKRARFGRIRRLFKADKRSAPTIEKEASELNISVPLMLMKSLGVDIVNMYHSVHLQAIECQEQLLKFPAYEDDAEFQKKEKEVDAYIQRESEKTEVFEEDRVKNIADLKRRRLLLSLAFKKRYMENKRVLQNKLRVLQQNEDRLKTLIDGKKDDLIDMNLSLMRSDPSFEKFEDFDDSFSAGEDSGETVEEKPEENEEEGSESVLKKLRNKRPARQTNLECEPPSKKTKTLTLQELAEERSKVTVEGKKIFSDLPLLPPNTGSLRFLRALLLRKRLLIKRAGDLYFYESVQDKKAPDSAEKTTESVVEVDDVLSSVSWLRPSTEEQLQHEASMFEGFKSNRCKLYHPYFDAVIPPTAHGRMSKKKNIGKVGEDFKKKNVSPPPVSWCPKYQAKPLESQPPVSTLPQFPSSAFGNKYCIVSAPLGCQKIYAFAKPPPKLMTVKKPTYTYSKMNPKVNPDATDAESNNQIEVSLESTDKSTKPANPNTAATDKSTKPANPNTAATDESTKPANPNTAATDESTKPANPNTAATDKSTKPTNPNMVATDKSTKPANPTMDASTMQATVIAMKKMPPSASVDKDPSKITSTIPSADQKTSDNSKDTGTPSCTKTACAETVANSQSSGPDAPSTNSCSSGVASINTTNQQSLFKAPENVKSGSVKASVNTASQRSLGRKVSNKVVVVIEDDQNDSNNGVIVGKGTQASEKVNSKQNKGEKICEVRPTTGAAGPSQKENSFNNLAAIRQSNEYKLLYARMKAILMWPILISTVEPTKVLGPVEPIPRPAIDRSDQSGAVRRIRRKTKKQHCKEHMEKMRLAARAKKLGVAISKTDTASEVLKPPAPTEPSSSVEPMSSEEGKPPQIDASPTETPQRKGRGRPKGAKNRAKAQQGPVERPKRSVTKVSEQESLEYKMEPKAREVVKNVPQWWKDAMVAAMLKKQAMDEDGEEDENVDIKEDEDFIDKGNYSDDEWAQEMKMVISDQTVIKPDVSDF
ncbi:uncharacterized protein LOC131953019 [Physella acuta]|uniref:uncharacterized protein LOC131953019 n=1 Tax=Physella acuta TaxID=109671 RepID=UPI0027DCFD06|nr:uncharacterized protein LOC131953019 [Physella acuta]